MDPEAWARAIKLLLDEAWYWVMPLFVLAAGFIYALVQKWRPRK